MLLLKFLNAVKQLVTKSFLKHLVNRDLTLDKTFGILKAEPLGREVSALSALLYLNHKHPPGSSFSPKLFTAIRNGVGRRRAFGPQSSCVSRNELFFRLTD